MEQYWVDRESQAFSHAAFADESQYTVGRYRAIALITLPSEDLDDARYNINALLSESNVGEFKWKKLTSARARFAATKLLDWTVDRACTGSLRLDTLIWDTYDQRHQVSNRDDIANMQRLYHRLFNNVLAKRWPDDATWGLFPDENTAMRWRELKIFLVMTSSNVEVRSPDLLNPSLRIDHSLKYKLVLIQPCKSDLEPLVQLADLFAGLAVYSWTRFEHYAKWKKDRQPRLFADDEEIKLSSSDKERCQVLHDFNQACKARALQVGLNSSRGLFSHNPSKPINFWLYQPQHEADKAPTKGG